MVSTLKFKQQTQIDLKKSMDGVLQSGSARRSKYDRQNKKSLKPRGRQRVKAYGTFTNKCNY
jgi:hypothetical protein